MMNRDETTCTCALASVFGFEAAAGAALIGLCGSAQAVFGRSHEELAALTGPAGAPYLSRITDRTLSEAQEHLRKAADAGACYLIREDAGYPDLLRECPDAPLGLWYRSAEPPQRVFDSRPAIAVVGTRDLSSYGREWCARIVTGMAQSPSKPLIVSGLAIGADYTAHSTALDSGLPTVAVMATGIDEVYPFRHGHLAERIAATPGCALLTDFPPGTAPLPLHFLRRNRIIAGLSQATVLIESRIRGGGMNTARVAFGYDRDVFALPGRVDDLRSQGCNLLIRDRVAESITDVPELVSRLGLGSLRGGKKTDLGRILQCFYGAKYPADETEKLLAVALAVKRQRDIDFEGLTVATGLGYAEVSSLAGILESDGFLHIGLMQSCSLASGTV